MPWKTGLHHDLQSEGIKYQHGKTYVKTKYFYIFLDEVLERCPWIYLKKTLIFQRQALSPETQRWVAKPSSQSSHAVFPGIATKNHSAILSEAQHVFSILNLPLQALIPAVVLADGYRTPVTLISKTPTLSKSWITPYPIHTHNTYQQISRPSRPPSLRLGLPSPGQIPRIPRIPSVSFVVRHDIMALMTCLTRCHGCVALLQICHGGKDLGKNWLIMYEPIVDHKRLQICNFRYLNQHESTQTRYQSTDVPVWHWCNSQTQK